MNNKIITAIASVLIFVGASFVQAEQSKGESPNEGLSEILKLYKAQNWEGIVQQRCLDKQHADSQESVAALVDGLKNKLSDAEAFNALVGSYEAALISQPQIESEGSVAIFSSAHGSITLSKMDTGKWGVRL